MAGRSVLRVNANPRTTSLYSYKTSYSVIANVSAVFSGAYKTDKKIYRKSSDLPLETKSIPCVLNRTQSLRLVRCVWPWTSNVSLPGLKFLGKLSDFCALSSAGGSCRHVSYSHCLSSAHNTSGDHDRAGSKVDFKKIDDLELDLTDDVESDEMKLAAGTSKQNFKPTDDRNTGSGHDDSRADRKGGDFEYDYEVAEDIEEYDYMDETVFPEQVRPEKVLPISLERGENGVFELQELVTLLEHLGAENIVTFPIPPEANFCDHMVVVSAKSQRHLQAINDELLWVHKRKKSKKDPHLLIEGLKKSYWCAMDMGNIVLHIFYGEAREYYDIESLWTLGPECDPKCQTSSIDPYALSPEDLFWLETAKADDKAADADEIPPKDHSTANIDDGVTSASNKATGRSLKTDQRVLNESDAGWDTMRTCCMMVPMFLLKWTADNLDFLGDGDIYTNDDKTKTVEIAPEFFDTRMVKSHIPDQHPDVREM